MDGKLKTVLFQRNQDANSFVFLNPAYLSDPHDDAAAYCLV